MSPTSATTLSILDRANTRVVNGNVVGAGQIFAEVTARAQQADELGYHRFWVAEHHSVPGIVGSAPTLLIPHLAAATSTLRLGTGGIMVPSHQPLVIAEHIGTLQALVGGRFDAGLGASTGFTKPVRTALRQATNAKEEFPDDVDAVLNYLRGTADITAYPQDDAQTEVYILSGGGSAGFAASRGLGLVLGGPSVTRGLSARAGASASTGASASNSAETEQHSPAAAEYHQKFQTDPIRAQQPRIIASLNVTVAETRQAAEELILSEAWALTQSRSIGVFQPLTDPTEVRAQEFSPQQQRRIAASLKSSVYGTPDEVVQQLTRVVAYTQADEILVTGNIWDPAAQLASDRLLAAAWSAR